MYIKCAHKVVLVVSVLVLTLSLKYFPTVYHIKVPVNDITNDVTGQLCLQGVYNMP